MWSWGRGDETEEPTAASSSTPSAPSTASPAGAESTRVTRQQAQQSTTPIAHLQLPLRRETPREYLRRVRTPSPQPTREPSFDFQQATMDDATLQRILTAALRASQENQVQQVQSLKKPDLPAFDKRNIEIWIKRVEAAFIRVNITDPKLKFAHIESKFQVGEDPVVDEYLYGTANQESWDKLLKYFRDRYGKTKKEMVSALINGVPREGRTPSQLAAAIDDKAGDASIDDIKKEQLLRQLPPDVLKQIVDRVDNLDFKETAKLADSWFDKDGKPRINGDASSINQVSHQAPNTSSSTPTASAAPSPPSSMPTSQVEHQFTSPFEEESDINAIRHQQVRKQQFNSANRGSNNSRSRGSFQNSSRGNRGSYHSNSNGNNNTNNSSSYNNSNYNTGQRKTVCHFHTKFGPAAERCEPWCLFNPAKNGKANN